MVTGQGFCWKFDFDSLKFESEFLFHILLVWIYVIYLCCLLYKIDCVCEYFVWCLSRLACFYCTISLWTMLHDLFWSSVLLCTLHFFFSCHGINYWLCYGIMMNFPNISVYRINWIALCLCFVSLSTSVYYWLSNFHPNWCSICIERDQWLLVFI
jgi:hypothetical protein